MSQKRHRKADHTILLQLRYLEQVQEPGAPFSEAAKDRAYMMATVLRWVLYHDVINPTNFFLWHARQDP